MKIMYGNDVRDLTIDRPSIAGQANSKRTPEVARVMEELDKASHDLHEAISSLEERLAPVTGPETPSLNAKETGTAYQTGHANYINGCLERVQAGTRRIRSIRDRLEL